MLSKLSFDHKDPCGQKDGTVFSPMIVSSVAGIEYHPILKLGVLRLLYLCHPDMSGTIALFKRIDKNVERVAVFSGSCLDLFYELKDGEWRCVDCDHSKRNRELGQQWLDEFLAKKQTAIDAYEREAA